MTIAQKHTDEPSRPRPNKHNVDRFKTFARILREGGPDQSITGSNNSQTVVPDLPSKGEILAALRRSPLVDADLDLVRHRQNGQDFDV